MDTPDTERIMNDPGANPDATGPKVMPNEKERNAELRTNGDGTSVPPETNTAVRQTEGEHPITPESPADLLAAYQKLQGEKGELYDRLLRKQAEFENFRKRVHREKDDFLQHANVDLIRSMLPVLDGFERALQHRDASVP